MDPSVLANMDKDALKKQIENMKYQVSMERWPLSRSIAATRTCNHLLAPSLLKMHELWRPLHTNYEQYREDATPTDIY
ncbi:Guanine nucleotide-binding protein subunit gamma-e [Dufourea novaeangliae]|uniref:Guanine nucleotide-binding protein subunit gamma-e n=1 Tax=Dufourea novaeangliae TaxID=178035 RepID=A0A154P9R2_DUFNO|nr:Guanine nucleotide-binding protein subunit gamma-e [Dufourea novaeangliae]